LGLSAMVQQKWDKTICRPRGSRLTASRRAKIAA
jgi:hypothetical protein